MGIGRHVDLVEVTGGDERRARVEALTQDLQLGMLEQVAHLDGGMARMGHVVHLVEAVGEEVVLVTQPLREHAKELRWQLLLADAIEVVQRGERRPAQVHGREDVLLAPVHDAAVLVPVVDLLEGQVLHRRARDDEAVVVAVGEGVEGLVELDQVVGRDVLGLVGGDPHEVAIHLDRRLGDEPQNLSLGLDLGGHEV